MFFWGRTGRLTGISKTFTHKELNNFPFLMCHLSYQFMTGNGCSTNRHLQLMLQCEKLDEMTSWGLPMGLINLITALDWIWAQSGTLTSCFELFLEKYILSPQLVRARRAETIYFSLVFHSTGCRVEHIVGTQYPLIDWLI